jgi:DsbC/DsbD-like thiol-disulfide interchange protein
MKSTFCLSEMRTALLAAFLFCFTHVATAQTPQPVKWSCSVERGKGDQATLVMTATIADGWHLYSQDLPEGGPIKTEFIFESSAEFNLLGPVEEGKPTDYYDPNFEMQLKYFSHKAVFRQKIELKTKQPLTIAGTVEFMVCDDKRCLPPDEVELSFDLKQ